MRRFLIIAALAAGALAPAAAVVASSPLAQASEGSVGIRLLEVPTARADDPRARIYIVDHLAPGTTIRRRIEVSNGTDERLRIALYAAGAEVSEGGFRFLDGRQGNELSSWTSVSTPAVDVGARSAEQVVVTIAVPVDAAAGERYAVVWAELPPSRPTGAGVTAVNRVGIRVYLSVGAGGEPSSDFTIESLTAARDSDGRPVVSAGVRNTGGRALDLAGELRLSEGPGGLSAGPFPARLGTALGVGERAAVLVLLDPAIPAGPWQAIIVLRSGTLERKASGRITFPAAAGASASPVPANPVGRIPLLSLAFGLAFGLAFLVLLGLLAFFLLKRRRRGEEDDRPEARQHEPAPRHRAR